MSLKIIILFIATAISPSAFSEPCIPWSAQSPTLQDKAQFKIGEINISSQNVFDLSDEKESAALHHWANKFHIKTQDAVIKRQLLFSTGDLFQLSKLIESGRLLRANRYIKSATVRPVEVCGDEVTIEVKTQDNWTLTPDLSFGNSGGENQVGISLQEQNLLGLGKSVSVGYKQDVDRDSLSLAYFDPQLLGSRKRLLAVIQDNSDGDAYRLELGLPFYSLDSQRSWGVKVSAREQEDSIYKQGVITEKIGHENISHALIYGWSKGLENNSGDNLENERVKRFKVGWKYIEDNYKATPSTTALPTSLVESYPLLAYESFENKFITKTNFKTMGRIEDVSLGQHFSTEVGFLHQQTGSDDNHLKLSLHYTKGYELGAKNLGFIGFDSVSYLGDGLRKGETVSLAGEWYSFNEVGNDYYAKANVLAASNLQIGEQILLGERRGLRGYPIGYQTGNRSALFTVEKRIRFKWHPLQLAQFGAVAFADVGAAWDGNEGGNNGGNQGENRKDGINILYDVGLGFRIFPTRLSSASSIHIDFAVPLVEQDKVDNYQFLITTKQSF